MKNYKNYLVDLSNCDSEPIHLIGRIQPHGFLLILDKATLVIEQVSANISLFLDVAIQNLLDHSLADFITSKEYGFLKELFQQKKPVSPQLFSWQGKLFFGFIHSLEDKITLEAEPYTGQTDQDKIFLNHQITGLYEQLNVLDDLESVSEVVANVLLNVLQYDRVEVIQFDTDWHSEVIGEARNSKLPSYLGHHFPASDIPAQARELLLQKPVRQIPDVNAEAVEIIPYYNPATNVPTNILASELRNPSEIHLEYVKNMGVGATISFSVQVKGNLWGLITCHHKTPVFRDVWKRQAGELITKAFANTILSLQEKRDKQQWAQFRQTEELLVKQIIRSRNIHTGLLNINLNLLSITESTGAALFLDNKLTCFGQVPGNDHILSLIDWLVENNNSALFCTHELSVLIPAAAAYQEVASGLLALEISKYNKEFLLYFKPEIKETRVWAGKPHQPQRGADLQLHPRKSFEKWEEVIKGKSECWTLNEKEITQKFLQDITSLQLRNQAAELQDVNQELTYAVEALQKKNDQLEDFAHIISHNLRSPLNNINGLHQFYSEEPTPENAAFVLDNIRQISKNMALTIEDLNTILTTRINHQLPVEEVLLADLIQKEIQNLTAIIEQTQAELFINLEAPTIWLPRIYVESILHNLISNALKYCSPERLPVISIHSWIEDSYFYLSVTDNGLGMDLQNMGHKLFGLYKTFHRHEQAKGLGLYLTKIQIESLGGKIKVSSELNKGTTFTVSFKRKDY